MFYNASSNIDPAQITFLIHCAVMHFFVLIGNQNLVQAIVIFLKMFVFFGFLIILSI